MTISSTTTRNDFTGNGATTSFSYSFGVYSTSDVSVYVAGVLQVLGTDYTITGGILPTATGGSVVFGTAPANNAAVALIRSTTYLQPYDPKNNATFDSQNGLEPQLDKTVEQVQQILEKLNRIPALKAWSTTSLGDASLPDLVASQYVIVNGTATGFALSAGTAGTVAIPTSPANAVLRVNSAGTGVSADNLPVSTTGGLIWFVGITGGSSTAYTFTPSPFPNAYATGMVGWMRFHTACGAAPTLNLAGIGAKALMYYTSGGTPTALAANDIQTTEYYAVAYDASLDKFVLLGPSSASSFASFYDARTSSSNLLAGNLGLITGLVLTATAGTTTLSIATGAAMDSTGVQIIKLGSAFTKLLDATGTWTAGTGGKGNQAASGASTSYHIFLIGKTTDLTAADIFFDTSVTAANLAASAAGSAGFNLFRRIGSLKSDGSKNWVVTRSYELPGGGLRFELDVPIRDFSTNNPGTSAVTWTTSIPTGVKFLTECVFDLNDTGGTQRNALITSPDQTDTAPSSSLWHVRDSSNTNITGSTQSPIRRMCSTSATLRYRLDTSAAAVTATGFTLGWEDSRR